MLMLVEINLNKIVYIRNLNEKNSILVTLKVIRDKILTIL